MPGKVDALLESIGGLREDIGEFRADIGNLKHDRDQLERNHATIADGLAAVRDKTQASISELRDDMNRRFAEAAARDAEFEQQLAQHAEKVSTIQPQITALQFSRSRLVTLASIGFTILTGLAWCVEAAVRWAVDRVLSVKFGG